MIATGKKWRRMKALALFLLVCTSCVSARARCHIDMRNQPYKKDALLKGAGHFTLLTIDNCHLDSSYMMILGKNLPPSVQEVHLNLAAVPDYIPTKEQKSAMVGCTTVKALKINYSPTSLAKESKNLSPFPQTLAWTNRLFPKASKMEIDVEALPVQDKSRVCQRLPRELVAKGVTDLVLTGQSENSCPIQENVNLFPNAVRLDISYIPTLSALEAWEKKPSNASRVEFLALHEHMPVSEKFMGSLKTSFPRLRELSIGMDMFLEITNGKPIRFLRSYSARGFPGSSSPAGENTYENVDDLPFGRVEKLKVRSGSGPWLSQAVKLGKMALAEVFASLG